VVEEYKYVYKKGNSAKNDSTYKQPGDNNNEFFKKIHHSIARISKFVIKEDKP
jgi:hypothetical protein